MTTEEIITQLWIAGRTAQCIERNLLVVYGRAVSQPEIWLVIGKYAREQQRKRTADEMNALAVK